MNWALLWLALQSVIFWLFLFYGLIASAGNVFGEVKNWQERWAFSVIFLVCLSVFARAIHIL